MFSFFRHLRLEKGMYTVMLFVFCLFLVFLPIILETHKSFPIDSKFFVSFEEKSTGVYDCTISLDLRFEEIRNFNIDVIGDFCEYTIGYTQLENFKKINNSVNFLVKFPISGWFRLCIIINNKKYEQKIKVDNPFQDKRYSSMKCHGNNYSSRWCEITNIKMENSTFSLYFPYKIKLIGDVLNPSCRGPPYYVSENTISNNTIKIFNKPRPDNVTWIEKPAFILSRYYNHMLLWHNAMDFTVPLYRTMKSVNKTSSDNIIVAYDMNGSSGLFYAKLLTNNSMIRPKQFDGVYYFEYAVLGLRKNDELQKDKSRIELSYDIDKKSIEGFRDSILEGAGKPDCKPNPKEPKVLIVKRRTNREIRRIINVEELINKTKELCPRCFVDEVDLQKYDKVGQIKYTCDASMLIGIHGSGLVHALWMEPHSVLVEVLPYMYTCRNWYKKLADAVGVEYRAINTISINQSRWDSWHKKDKVARCHSNPNLCLKGSCHDFLRDQSVIVDLKQYEELVGDVLKKLDS